MIGVCFLPFALAGSVGPLNAGEVDARLSNGQAYVGEPITMQVTIENAGTYKTPELPVVDGLLIESAGTPRRSSQTTIINGRRSSRQSVTLLYRVTPARPGTFEIPAMEVTVDGQMVQTPKLGFVASVSETGDLLLVEIEGKQDRVYVGEPLELTLRIWVRPYRDDKLERPLSEGEMWQMLSDRTSWGSFESAFTELAEQRQRPGGEAVVRKNQDGQSTKYYRYEIDTTIYPNKPGEIDASNVRIKMNYPMELRMERRRSMVDEVFGGRMRSPFGDPFDSAFGSQLVISKTRPISATADVDATEVIPIPSEGRPESFQGAVGRYEIDCKTDRRKVTAGDPITLQISVSGDGPLGSVQAPPLEKLQQEFRIDGQPLAGFIRDGRKYFTTTVRPVDESVTEIPSIEMSFFNPQSEEFETVASDPIEIEVAAAERLAMDAIVGPDESKLSSARESDRSGKTTQISSVRSWLGLDWLRYDWLLANRADQAVLQNQPKASVSFLIGLVIVLPMIVLLAVECLRRRSAVATIWQRLRSPRNLALAQLSHVETTDEIPGILGRYVLVAFSTSRHAANADWHLCLGVLRAAGHTDLAANLETLNHRCQSGSAIDPADSKERLDGLIAQSQGWLDSAELARRQSNQFHQKPTARNSHKTKITNTVSRIGMICLGIALPSTLMASNSVPVLLDSSQQETLLREANQAYANASALTRDGDTETAKDAFNVAADKYQTLVDSGVENGLLHTNLANAYLQSGQLGRAVAHYRIAQIYDPTDLRNQVNLIFAQSRLGVAAWQWFMPLVWLSLGIVIWLVGCGILAMDHLREDRSWRLPVVAVVMSVSCFLIFVRQTNAQSSVVIPVVPTIELRSGDGLEFDIVTELNEVEGRAFHVNRGRGNWWLIETDTSVEGWVSAEQVVAIASQDPVDQT